MASPRKGQPEGTRRPGEERRGLTERSERPAGPGTRPANHWGRRASRSTRVYGPRGAAPAEWGSGSRGQGQEEWGDGIRGKQGVFGLKQPSPTGTGLEGSWDTDQRGRGLDEWGAGLRGQGPG